jgi:dihydrofolate synthase / folylpolyglutamate synthase
MYDSITSEIENFFSSLTNWEKIPGSGQFSLEPVKNLVQELHIDLTAWKIVHIAGTNGKGSTGLMLEALALAHGLSTGLYTSPHLESLTERVQLNGKSVSGYLFNEVFSHIEQTVKGSSYEVTFFDILTAAALEIFSRESPDLVILETGMGGKLDSTNIVTPDCSIITSISLDHTKYLGETVEEIASEKGGIIKERVPVISGCDEEPQNVIRAKAEEKNARLYEPGSDFHYEVFDSSKKTTSFRFTNSTLQSNIIVNHPSEIQAKNASLAIQAFSLLFPELCNISAIRESFSHVILPGRFEIISESPTVIYDSSHNPEAMRIMCRSADKLFSRHNIVVYYAVMKDKDRETISEILHETFMNIFYINLEDDPRSLLLSPEDHRENIISSGRVCHEIKKYPLETVFIFTGTFHLYSIARRCFDKL